MRIYFAPMEGVTGAVFRRVHRRHFSGVDKYFMPFISPTQDHILTKKDLRELDPARNGGVPAVPQLLTRRAEDFLWAAGELAELGYREVNLNLGCPSGTVTAKGKGSGFLRLTDELDRFLEEVYARAPLAVSVKTRVGFQDPEEFGRLLEIFGRYPIAELTVHPRVRQDFYRGRVRLEAFAQAAENCPAPLCYNGDLATAADCAGFAGAFPRVEAVMLGRGLVGDPALAAKAKGGDGADRAALRRFHDELYDAYAEAFGSRRNAMLRMKEVWFYLIDLFEDREDHGKRLKKAKDTAEFDVRVEEVFGELALRRDSAAGWREAAPFPAADGG